MCNNVKMVTTQNYETFTFFNNIAHRVQNGYDESAAGKREADIVKSAGNITNDYALAMAHNIDRAISAAGMTRTALAHVLHVSPSTITGWCSGATEPPVHWLKPIADALGITPAALVTPGAQELPHDVSMCPVIAASVPDTVRGYAPIPSAWHVPGCAIVCSAAGMWLCADISDSPQIGLRSVMYSARDEIRPGYALYDGKRWYVTDDSGAQVSVSAPKYYILCAVAPVVPSAVVSLRRP